MRREGASEAFSFENVTSHVVNNRGVYASLRTAKTFHFRYDASKQVIIGMVKVSSRLPEKRKTVVR